MPVDALTIKETIGKVLLKSETAIWPPLSMNSNPTSLIEVRFFLNHLVCKVISVTTLGGFAGKLVIPKVIFRISIEAGEYSMPERTFH